MANRTGQQHNIIRADRTIKSGAIAPQVQYSTVSPDSGTSGQGIRNLSSVLGEISNRLEDRLDLQAQIDGARQGAIAGTKDGLPELQDEATIRGRAFNQSARDTAITRIDLQSRQELAGFENKHTANPQEFRNAADAYIKGQMPALEQFDPALAQRFAAQYETRVMQAETRVKSRHEAIVRDQQMETVIRGQMAIQDEMAQDAASLFGSDAQTAQITLAKMIGNAGQLIDMANQIGPDGRPLFTAQQRIAAEREAENMVSEQVVMSWMRKQPDMVSAFKAWQDGKAEIILSGSDGRQTTVNLRDMLGERGYRNGGKAFMETLRSELALQARIDTISDRAFEKGSDELFTDLSVLKDQGQLTLDIVEKSKSRLTPDRYLTAREMARSVGPAVSNGPVYSELAIADANNEDIRPRLRQAFANGDISQKDYIDLYNRNVGRVDQGAKDPIRTGRDYLTQGLGVLSKEIGMAQSAAIGQADAEYEISIQDFMAKNERQPTHTEARDMAETIRRRFSVMNVEDNIFGLPLPSSMTQAEKLDKKTNSQTIAEKIANLNAVYAEKYGGDTTLRNADPAYISELGLLKRYYDLYKMKEDSHAGQ